MAGKYANRRSLFRLRGFLTITIIAIVITAAYLVDETESARDTKRSTKSVKSNKDKEKCQVERDDDGIYYVRCFNSSGEKGDRNKNRKANKPGESRKRPANQCSSECRGRRGQRGQRGKPGSKGQQGVKGAKGSPGVNGFDGLDGLLGPKGEIGPIGNPGLKGASGLQGVKGDQGPRGRTGSPGPPGVPKNCEQLSNTSLTSEVPTVYCLPGEQGPKGTKGDIGEPGKLGPTGPRGIRGPRGSKGHEGARGKKGDPGPPGNFVGLVCLPRYTNWINKSDWFSKHPEVHCDRREFLQGFSLEEHNSRGQRRYRYTCCALRLTHTP